MAEDANKKQGHANEKTHERIDHAADRIKQETDNAARATREKTEQAEERIDQTTDAAARAAHRAADKTADWRQRGAAAMDEARGCADNWFEEACAYVREKPVQSVVVALAAGWLIGRLLSSRR